MVCNFYTCEQNPYLKLQSVMDMASHRKPSSRYQCLNSYFSISAIQRRLLQGNTEDQTMSGHIEERLFLLQSEPPISQLELVHKLGFLDKYLSL